MHLELIDDASASHEACALGGVHEKGVCVGGGGEFRANMLLTAP